MVTLSHLIIGCFVNTNDKLNDKSNDKLTECSPNVDRMFSQSRTFNFQWKTDDDDDADFSFEPTGNDFSQVMDFKPVVVPEWKERNIEFWDKNIGISDTDGATSMQVRGKFVNILTKMCSITFQWIYLLTTCSMPMLHLTLTASFIIL